MSTSKNRRGDEIALYEAAQSCEDLLRLEREELKFESRWLINFENRVSAAIYQYLLLHPEQRSTPDARFLFAFTQKTLLAQSLPYIQSPVESEDKQAARLAQLYAAPSTQDQKQIDRAKSCIEWVLRLLRAHRHDAAMD